MGDVETGYAYAMLASVSVYSCAFISMTRAMMLTISMSGPMFMSMTMAMVLSCGYFCGYVLSEALHLFPATQTRNNHTETILFAILFDQ